jgi:hypothetical protein
VLQDLQALPALNPLSANSYLERKFPHGAFNGAERHGDISIAARRPRELDPSRIHEDALHHGDTGVPFDDSENIGLMTYERGTLSDAGGFGERTV